jgi:hypothetical protein
MTRTKILVVFGVFYLSSPAHAEWKIQSYKDRMTDREVKVATLQASKPDHGISAVLVVRCLENDLVGGLYLAIRLTTKFTPGRMGLRYRVDNAATNDRFMPVDSDLQSMTHWGEPSELIDKKRIRVELQPTGGPNLFYEFDLRGTGAVLKSIPCRETRLR